MELVQVTLLSETNFGFQSKHIHLMKYCEYACAVISKFLGILDAAEKERGWLCDITTFGCCRRINGFVLVCDIVVQAFDFQCSRSENQDMASCLSCTTREFAGRKIKFVKFVLWN